jgi:hypothetical protein
MKLIEEEISSIIIETSKLQVETSHDIKEAANSQGGE